MSDTLKERTSALLDGELEPRAASETIDILLKDDGLLVHWCDVLRHKVYPDAGDGLRERMRSCLADEPLHFPAHRPLSRRWRKALKPVAGLALAASVAVVAIVAVRGLGQLPEQPEIVQVPSTALAPNSAAAIIPVSAIDGGGFQPRGLKRLQWNTSEPGVANRLNGYLLNHSEHVGGAVSGMHPYARIVGYDTTGQL